MTRAVGVLLLLVATAAAVACGARKPARVEPAPPAVTAAPSLLTAQPLDGVAFGWPPDLASAPVAALLEEALAPAPPPPQGERERAPDAAAPPPVPPVPDPPRLTTPETPDDAAATRQVRENLARARRALGALRYEQLSSDARAQYDTVVQLIQQAEDALRTRDFVFALKVADKAETLARRLGGQLRESAPTP